MKISKKLRDVTFKEWQAWEKQQCTLMEDKGCSDCIFSRVPCFSIDKSCWINNKELYSTEFLNNEIEIEIPRRKTK